MTESTDDRGRIHLPEGVRERYGDRYRIVELPSHVALFPVDEDPLAGARAAVDGALDDETTATLEEEEEVRESSTRRARDVGESEDR